MKTLSSVETEVKSKTTLMRPSSRGGLCGFILKGLIQDLLFCRLLKDDLSLSRLSGVLCAVHSVCSGSAWYALFILMWIQGVTPATLTAVGLVRTTVYGPF